MQTEFIKISKIVHNTGQIDGLPKNPRKKNEDLFNKLVKSIEEDPEMMELRELLVYPHNGKYVCIAGNMRLDALKHLGLLDAPCKVIDPATPVEKLKAYTIKDNASFGEWDIEMLAEDWDLSQLEDWGVNIEVPNVEVLDEEVHEDEFDESEVQESIVQPLEVWKLGEHRLMCGDSTSANDVAVLMDNQTADIAFTSPPYNASTSENLSGNTHTKGSKYMHSDDNLVDYYSLLKKSTINNIECSKFAFINLQMLANNKADICEYLHEFKDYLCDILIWNKMNTAPAMAENVCNSQFEFIFVFAKINPTRAIGTRKFRGTISNVFDCNPQRHNEFSNIHAATFSIEFVSNYINNFSNKDDKVIDLFGGTGTTLIACEQLHRKCYMMELDPHYCDVIIARWEKLTGQKAIKL